MGDVVFISTFLKIIEFSELHTEDFWDSECVLMIYFISCLQLLLISRGIMDIKRSVRIFHGSY
jgi:hypothetical protein